MRRIREIVVACFCVCLLASVLSITTLAVGTGSIVISNASGNVGTTVTVSGTIQGTEILAGAKVIMTYDTDALDYVSGSGGTFNVNESAGSITYGAMGTGTEKKFSFSMKFKIRAVTTSKISLGDYQVVELNSAEPATITKATSGTVTGKASTTNNGGGTTSNNGGGTTTTKPQDNKDSNNKLNSLQVYPGTLSPAFSAGTTSYSVTVPADTTEVTISATPQSSKANVTVSGGKDLKLGENTAQVVVVAENGSSAAYTITIMCGEVEKISVGGAEHTINENFTDEQIPTGFTRTKLTYNGRQYEGLTNATNNLQLINLQSGENTVYYIYNQTTQEFYNFVQVTIADGKYIIPLPLSDKVEQFKDIETVNISVQDKNFDAWKLDDEFSVVYVMNQDGEETLYRYDSVDGIFQRYTDATFEVSDTQPKTLFPSNYYMYAIIGLGSLCLILLIAMIYFIASRKHRHEGRKKKVQRNLEKQKAREEKQRLKEEKAAEKQRLIDEKEAAKQRAIDEKNAEKQRIIEEKQRVKEEKKAARKKKKDK